jgi:hypothetical protein
MINSETERGGGERRERERERERERLDGDLQVTNTSLLNQNRCLLQALDYPLVKQNQWVLQDVIAYQLVYLILIII